MATQNLISGFVKTLNRHGFAFQYAVLDEADRAFRNGKSAFAFEVAELPVRVQGAETKIDFVLRHVMQPIALICECKRVNPSLGNWCFVKAPWVHRDWTDGVMIVDLVQRRQQGSPLSVEPYQIAAQASTYQVAVPMRTHPAPEGAETGDQSRTNSTQSSGGGRDDLDKAIRQVLLGANGLLNLYISRDDLGKSLVGAKLALLPVVVTTARLWTFDIDLRETNLKTGAFPAETASLSEAEWVVYHEHMSPALKFDGVDQEGNSDLARTLHREFIRSVVIVTAQHFYKFVEWASRLMPAA